MSASAGNVSGGLHGMTWASPRKLRRLLGVVALAVVAIVGYFVGYGAGDNSSKVNMLTGQIGGLHAQVRNLQSQAPHVIATAKHQAAQELASARDEIASERHRASASVASAKGRVDQAEAKLRGLQGQISAASGHLSQLQSQISGARATIAKDTIGGDGTFVVGSDINPGTYKAAASPGCYWARLASLDTNNIIDNNNADGPVVVQIQPTDKAFETSGCADFHRVGP